ncbi:hypothetical protein PoHVEF18_008607 [Penicillium ochrochloron]
MLETSSGKEIEKSWKKSSCAQGTEWTKSEPDSALIANIEHWVGQARFDSTIPSEKPEGFETHLGDRLDAYSRKLNLADLYSRLPTEWMNPALKNEDATNHPSEDGDFEIVDERQKQRLKQLCDQSEDMVFNPCETSSDEITSFLQGLFAGEDVAYGYYTDLRNWDWHADSEGVPVLPRQQLNGKYRIWMDDDVLETIFVEHICMRLCKMLKDILKMFIEDEQAVWVVPTKPRMIRRDRLRRRYYCGEQWNGGSEACRKAEFQKDFFLTALPDDERSGWYYDEEPRKRRRGIPIAHASEKIIGELILFYMDLAVRHETGVLLYRLYDDIWLFGEPQRCAQSWEVMQRFANITGLAFNKSKTGSVYLSNSIDPSIASRLPPNSVKIGFLMLDPSSGDWVIDYSQVETHINQLKTQLDQCSSLLSWIRTWNSCIGRFFKNTFGEPAYCFGRPHIDAILSSYEKMHNAIFGIKDNCGGTLTGYLRNEINRRFGVSDIPDAFFFLPEKLGRLDVRNPFVSIFSPRQHLQNSPQEPVELFLKSELAEYDTAKNKFEKKTPSQRMRLLERLRLETSSEEEVASSREMHIFMTFAEWTRFRDETSSSLTALYQQLMDTPGQQSPGTTEKVEAALRNAQEEFGLQYIDAEGKWILYMYAEDLLTKFGGLNLVDKQYLPTRVLDMVKENKVRWQMVL